MTTTVNGVRVWVVDGELVPIIYGGKGGGGSSSTTTVQMPAPSANQTATEGLNLDMLKRQNTAFVQQMALQDPAQAMAYLNNPGSGNAMFAGLEQQDTPEFRQQLQDALGGQAQEKRMSDLVNRRLEEQVTGIARLSPEENAMLDETFQYSRSQGEADMTRYGQENAQMRGLNMSDSPVAAETARQSGQFNLGLQSARAQSALNLGESSKIFNANLQQFQAGLSQQAQMNRLSLGQQTPGLAAPMMNYFGQQQIAGRGTTSNTNSTLAQNWWQPLAGAAIQAVGTAAGGGAFKCWIAEVLYGKHSPETAMLRWYINGEFNETWIGAQLGKLYEWKGREVAGWLVTHPWAKPPFKWVFNRLLKSACSLIGKTA